MEKINRPNYLEVYIFGAIAGLLGLVVMFGWATKWPLLIQILPTFVPMQFNTALGFLLSGIILLSWYKLPRVSGVVSIVLLCLTVATLYQYIFLANLHIDELFIAHYINTYTSHPGRMSPNTALCFVLFGSAFLSLQFKGRWAKIIALSATFIVGILGTVSVLGYIFGLKFLFGWGNLTGMAFHTATGFAVIGWACFREFSFTYRQKRFNESLLLPIGVFSIGFIAFLLSWQSLVTMEDNKIQMEMKKDAHFLNEEIHLIIDSRVDAISRLFGRMVLLQNYNSQLTENDIDRYFLHYDGLLLISANFQSINTKLYINDTLSADQATNLVAKCTQRVVSSGNSKLYVHISNEYLCIYEPNKDLLAVFDTVFIERVIDSRIFTKYSILISRDGKVFYSNATGADDTNFYANQWSQTDMFELAGEQWKLVIWLDEQHVRKVSPYYPIFYLFMGLVLSLLLAYAIRIWQISQAKNVLLDELNQKFNAVIENTTTAIFIFNQYSRVIFFNARAETLTGYAKKELIGLKVSELVPMSNRSNHADNVKNYFSRPKQRLMGDQKNDISLLSKNGHEIPVEIGLAPIEIDSKRCVVATVVDISERRKSELKIQEYNLALKRSNDELDSFAYIASHDLKEPLRGIHNFAAFLMEDYADQLDEDGVHQLKTLQKLSSRMEDLINNLLYFSRVGRTELAYEECDTNEVIENKLDFISDFIEQHNAKIVINNKLPNIYCDSARIGEVFQNLITNAIKYNDKDTKVVNIAYEDEGDEVTFSVSDNGIGIEQDQFDNIFKIFKRLHTREEFGGGTGAGMTIVKKIIERHGGKIWLESAVGKGTTFYFSIPRNYKEK